MINSVNPESGSGEYNITSENNLCDIIEGNLFVIMCNNPQESQ